MKNAAHVKYQGHRSTLKVTWVFCVSLVRLAWIREIFRNISPQHYCLWKLPLALPAVSIQPPATFDDLVVSIFAAVVMLMSVLQCKRLPELTRPGNDLYSHAHSLTTTTVKQRNRARDGKINAHTTAAWI